MIDIEKLRDKAVVLYGDTTKKIKQYTPESFSKEKKFINALVISLVLMTIADKKIEEDEVIASMDLINEIEEIQELEMTKDAIELYEFHIENITLNLDNKTKWITSVAKLLSEVSRIKPYPEYPPMVETLLDYISEADGNVDPSEIEMKNRILAAIK